MIDKDRDRVSSTEKHESSVKKNMILELLANKLAYVWNAYVWPSLYKDNTRGDVHFAMRQILKIEEGESVLEVGSNMPMYQEYSKEVGERGLFVALDLHLQVQKKAQEILQKEEKELNNSPFLEK